MIRYSGQLDFSCQRALGQCQRGPDTALEMLCRVSVPPGLGPCASPVPRAGTQPRGFLMPEAGSQNAFQGRLGGSSVCLGLRS